MDAVNALDRDGFVTSFGAVCEGSPWVAEAAYARRPFAGPASERAAAGMHALTHAERERLRLLNSACRERFGFSFVICAREHTPASILRAPERRVREDPQAEEAAALAEVHAIARLRLADLVEER